MRARGTVGGSVPAAAARQRRAERRVTRYTDEVDAVIDAVDDEVAVVAVPALSQQSPLMVGAALSHLTHY